MRFTMKWVLAAMAYMALAAAAFSQETWVYADLLWVTTFVAFAFALHTSCFARGARQAAAAGFVVFCGCFALCLQFAPDSVPTTRVLLATGVGAGNNRPGSPTSAFRYSIPVYPSPAPVRVMTSGYRSPSPPVATGPAIAPTPLLAPPAVAPFAVAFASSGVDFNIYVRAANAVSTMAFGLLGCVLASFASRNIRKAKTLGNSGD